jgi:hypothetical protein
VVAADHDRRGELTRRDHLVEAQPGHVALAVAEPADARRQALEETRSCARAIQRAMCSWSPNKSRMAASVRAMSSGSPESATHRNGPLPSQNKGRM